MTLRIGGAAAAWMVMARLACAQSSPVPPLIRDVAPGSGALVVRADGSVVTWGSSPQGTLQVPTVLVLPGPAKRVAVCGSNLGRFTGYAILEDGTVVAWGANDQGQWASARLAQTSRSGRLPSPRWRPCALPALPTSSTSPPATGMWPHCVETGPPGPGARARMAHSARRAPPVHRSASLPLAAQRRRQAVPFATVR